LTGSPVVLYRAMGLERIHAPMTSVWRHCPAVALWFDGSRAALRNIREIHPARLAAAFGFQERDLAFFRPPWASGLPTTGGARSGF